MSDGAPIKYKNRRTGVVYTRVGDIMLNILPATVLKDGAILTVLKTPRGKFVVRPKAELKTSRFVRSRPMKVL